MGNFLLKLCELQTKNHYQVVPHMQIAQHIVLFLLLASVSLMMLLQAQHI